jgi:choline dehydrogenase
VRDVIVVGGGSAGCALAGRLSENPDCSVLLVEAGPPARRPELHVPAAYPRLFKTAWDWNYTTEPEPGLGGRQVYWPRAKVLGGCSAMNAMIYMRGNPADYDGWSAAGASGWGYREVLPLFKAAEDNCRGPSEYHGVGGPVRVNDQVTRSELSAGFVAAGQQWGLPLNHDFNGVRQDGVGWFQVTQRRGRRISAATAYLRPARRRPNLRVLTQSRVIRILFEGKRAVGVRCAAPNGLRDFHAGEIVLSAGAVNTPHLLLVSGVGPPEELARQGIPLRHAATGVGNRLADHAAVGVLWTTRTPSLGTAAGVRSLLTYAVRRRGPYASNIVEAGGFLRSDPALAAPDLQLHFAPVLVAGDGLTPPTEDGFILWVTLLTPEGHGSVRLASADPTAAPLLSAGYLSTEADVERTVSGLRAALEIGAKPALAAHATQRIAPLESDSDLHRFSREFLQTIYHPVGSCAIGSVVDPDLRLSGLAGLRIADASVLPALPRGNTNAPAMMIGEKAARLILSSD